MDVTKIPFIEKVGIVWKPDGGLQLPFDDSNHNHLQTISASAQFALAETASGQHLLNLFPELLGNVIPVLRNSNIKFKQPAQNTITAHASVSNDSLVKFQTQFEKNGRASIPVEVEVKDQEGTVTSVSEFTWHVLHTTYAPDEV